MKKLGSNLGGGILRLESRTKGQVGYEFDVWLDTCAVVSAVGYLLGDDSLLISGSRQEAAELFLGPEHPVWIRLGYVRAGRVPASLLSPVPRSWYAHLLPKGVPLGLVRSH